MPTDATLPSPYPTNDPILRLIGGTPMIDFPGPERGRLFCKLETENPTRSMKDRIALGILTEALAEGNFDTVVEASSGNTAGAVALVARRFGLRCILTCPASTSPQKIGYMRAFGAEVHPCPNVASDHPDHYARVARRLAEEHDAYFINQYHNQANPRVHYRWTGAEIWAQAGSEMTHLVGSMGTGGLLSGSARRVKERAAEEGRDVTVVGVDAERSNISNAFYGRDPGPYDTEVEGLGKGHQLPTMWFDYVDEIHDVADEEAFAQARQAAQAYGLLIGPSSGAALTAARQICQRDPEAKVVVIICDGGEQYFDRLFETENVAATKRNLTGC